MQAVDLGGNQGIDRVGEGRDVAAGPEGLEQDFEDDVDDVVGSHPVYDAAFEPLHGSVRADAPSGPHPGSDV